MNNEPLPCAHCGGQPKVQETPGTRLVMFSIYCLSCGLITLPLLTLREALEVWNRRVGMERTA